MYFKNPRNVFVDVSNNNIITNNNIEKIVSDEIEELVIKNFTIIIKTAKSAVKCYLMAM